jgi:hypothetical protein
VPSRHGRAASSARLGLAASLALIALTVVTPIAGLTPGADAYGWRSLGPSSGGYTPRFVWQRHDNCLWAAGTMLVDKWSHGRLRTNQWELRRASGDKKGGSSLNDLRKGFARAIGIKLAIPGWGGSMRWWQLLDRLEHGGGAILIGEYNRMPAHFSRWSPSYAARKQSSHAVYVERYDRRNGRVWIMDPLGPGGWRGEWIPVEDLHRFADIQKGVVQAVTTTPRRKPTAAPLIDQAYKLGAPSAAGLVIAGRSLAVSVPLRITAGFPRPAGHRFEATWRPTEDAAGTAPTVTRSKAIKATSGAFRAAVAVPSRPGLYRVDLRLRPASGRSPARAVGAVEVLVVGPYAATLTMSTGPVQAIGRRVPVTLGVANVGSIDWRGTLAPTAATSAPAVPLADSPAMLSLVWRTGGQPEAPAARIPLALAPGGRLDATFRVLPPPTTGDWRLETMIGHPVLGPMPDMLDGPPVVVAFIEPGDDPTD